MGIRLFKSTWVGATAAFVAPILGLGFYASHTESFGITVNAAVSGVGSVHNPTIKPVAAGTTKSRIAPEAEHLFLRPMKGPRADRYMMLTRSTRGTNPTVKKAKKPVMVAKASMTADTITTGAIPAAVPNSMKELRNTVRREFASGLPGPRDYGVRPGLENSPRTGASLFLSALSHVSVAELKNDAKKLEEQKKEEKKPENLKTDLPGKKKKRLAFAGETESEYQARQRRCLATAIYFEARGEPIKGQVAVAQVVMNRVRSSLYPDTICGVVYQGQHRRTGCQFSFTCDGIADKAKDKERWRIANEIAYEYTQGEKFLSDIGHATHYHATYVSPRWRRSLNRIKKVGQHIFYRVRGEQIEDILMDENPGQGRGRSRNG